MTDRPAATPGAKMLYLIRRKAAISREELIAHWYAHHMPAVIRRQKDAAVRGEPFARRYFVSLFDAGPAVQFGWDGVAQLWWAQPQPKSETPHGTTPTDSFHERADPYESWATTEYVVVDGSEHLSVAPLTLNAPYPSTRSGFFKVSFLVQAKAGIDYDTFFAHWLDVHVPNVRDTLLAAGGFRYVVSQSTTPVHERYAGLAELYFHDAAGWTRYRSTIKEDGMAQWVEREGMPVLTGGTELIGLP